MHYALGLHVVHFLTKSSTKIPTVSLLSYNYESFMCLKEQSKSYYSDIFYLPFAAACFHIALTVEIDKKNCHHIALVATYVGHMSD